MGKALRWGGSVGALIGLWISVWPALLWWASISGWLYGQAPSARSRQMLIDAANSGWAHGRTQVGLGGIAQPLTLVLVAILAGAILGAYCGAVIALLRIDRPGHARAAVLWVATLWRQPRAFVWWAILVVVSTLFYVAAMPVTFGLAVTLPIGVRIAGLNLLGAALALGVPLLLVRRTVLGPEPRTLATVREFGLLGWRTWLALILPIAVAFIPLAPLVLALYPLVAAVSAQLLIGRGLPHAPWFRTLRLSTIGAFYLQAFYLLLVIVVIAAPVATVTLLNVYGTPPIVWVYQHEKLALPTLYAMQLTVSDYVLTYWWTLAPQIVVPLFWLFTGRLAWLFLRGTSADAPTLRPEAGGSTMRRDAAVPILASSDG